MRCLDFAEGRLMGEFGTHDINSNILAPSLRMPTRIQPSPPPFPLRAHLAQGVLSAVPATPLATLRTLAR